MSDLRFDNRVAIITGAGNGLGRSHALLLGSRGCKVIVNDLGTSTHGSGRSSAAADKVVEEIKAMGGMAVANYDSVEDGDKIVKAAIDAFGRVDILINNAGILRDASFQKMTQEDWDLIYRVHVLGAFRVTHAAWNHMRDAGYGRIVFTASAAGIYGNFGQANYSMAKLGTYGFASTLAIEGRKRGVVVNTIAPIAGSRMTETVMPKELVDALRPEYVSPLVAYLCHESCEETGGLYEVGGGFVGKLRWQRTEGKTFKLGRAITPEAIQKSWGDISNFDKASAPTDINSAMQPVIANTGSKSQGGNEFIDVDQALGYEFPPVNSSYNERDLALYALGVGAAQDPLDDTDLQFVYEMHRDGFKALPTFGVIPGVSAMMKMAQEGKQAPGLNYGFDRVLHGEQYTEIKRPLPPKAKLTTKAKIKQIFDKGKNAVIVNEIRSFDESGEELIYNELTTVIRGAGGWGGDRGPTQDQDGVTIPDRAPDAVVSEKVNANQALLYRLSGDWNPLHADPTFAKNFGFERPILHGLCTFGYAGRHIIKSFCKGDPRYFKSVRARFSESVFPGETLITEMWKMPEGGIVFRSKVKERDKVVISNAVVQLHKELPVDKPKAAATQAAAQSSGGMSGTGAIFWGIRHYIEKNPELVSKVGKVFQFKLTNPDSTWTVDVKNGKGAVTEGAAGKADCTLELADEDFLGMSTGKADPQKLYLTGKLKIAGDVMASQKLSFLKKIDAAETAAAMKAAGVTAGGASAGGGAAKTNDSAGPVSGDVFIAIRDHIERHPELISKVATVFQMKLTNPDSIWTLDVKNGKGSVSQGVGEKADVTLELSDEDFIALTNGKADAQKLYFSGKLKISGNVMASQKMSFLKHIDPEAAKAAVAKAKASGTTIAAAQARDPQAPKVFDALAKRLASTPTLVGEVGAKIQFAITEPASSWVVDLKNGKGSVTQGKATDATTTLTIADDDLALLAKGDSPKDLYQHGKLKVSGDMRPAQKLGFFKQLV